MPYYEQLYDLLLDQVREGLVPAKSRLPSESELHREFGLSRATVRQALELLETNGWATRVARRGYFASSPPQGQDWLIDGQSAYLESEIGHGVRTSVRYAEHGTLPEHACRRLDLPDPSEGFVLERLGSLGDEPVVLSTSYLPTAAEPLVLNAPGVLRGETSLTRTLRDGGFTADRSRRVVQAVSAPRRVAELLQVREGSALLRIRSVSQDATGTPFDYNESWLRTDHVPLELAAGPHRFPFRV